MNRQRLREELIRDEGLRLKAYRDSLGFLTIGVGHLLPSTASSTEVWTHERAMAELEIDIDIALRRARVVFGMIEDLDDARQRALVNMSFNLGGRIKGFVRFVAAVRVRDWEAAAKEMENSLWWTQVGPRAVRLRDMILTGSA